MNFLRRVFSTEPAQSASAEASSSEPTPRLPDFDICFHEFDEVEVQLKHLWTGFTDARERGTPKDADVAFDAFLRAFLRVYEGWSPGEVDGEKLQRAYALAGFQPSGAKPSNESSFMFRFSRNRSKQPTAEVNPPPVAEGQDAEEELSNKVKIAGCDAGHPRAVINGMVAALRVVADSLGKGRGKTQDANLNILGLCRVPTLLPVKGPYKKENMTIPCYYPPFLKRLYALCANTYLLSNACRDDMHLLEQCCSKVKVTPTFSRLASASCKRSPSYHALATTASSYQPKQLCNPCPVHRKPIPVPPSSSRDDAGRGVGAGCMQDVVHLMQAAVLRLNALGVRSFHPAHIQPSRPLITARIRPSYPAHTGETLVFDVESRSAWPTRGGHRIISHISH
eukprot:989865-Prorocentrum_minimum.AAC.2